MHSWGAGGCTFGLIVLLALVDIVSAPRAQDELEPEALGLNQLRSPDVPLVHDGMARPAPSATREEDGLWLMPLKDYGGTRYSGLDQINSGNVQELELAWVYETGLPRGHEAAPIVVNDTMYVVMPYPNPLVAFDLTRPGPAVKWTYDPEPNPAAQGLACCDAVNRGAAFGYGKLFFVTLDGQVAAVDADTGEEVWKVQLGDVQIGETMTMAPLVVKDKVLVGNSGGEFGVRGWIAALDVDSGDLAWKAFTTGPDEDVLIGPNFRPFYAQDRGTDLGVTTWPGSLWRIGGGNVWGWINYDPELDLIYHGTANPAPWNSEMRPGDNKWTAGIFARRPDTGEAIWAYQWSPHDLYDYDGVNENVLLDMPWQGEMRQVLVRPERNGYVYILDRATGEVLSATPYGHITTTQGVDLETGRLMYVPEKEPQTGRVVRDLCPAAPGAKDWQPSSFSPRTGILYIPHQNICMDEEGVIANYIAGTPYLGAVVQMKPGPGGHRGLFTAWDVARQEAVWEIRERFPVWSGALATAGDVVFYGTMDRWFKAVDAQSGELLWEYQTNTGIVGQPVTYLGPDGTQYVAVLSGPGGWAGAVVSVPIDPRDGGAALGFVNAMQDLPQYTDRGGFLYVFRLP